MATIVNLTATGDLIIGPGDPIYIAKGLPVSCMGDAVSGALCVAGFVTMTTAINKITMGRPMANMGSLVMGISMLGFPVPTAVLVCQNINIIV
jgi:hypothetical protein